jgi:hypothetical protein
MPQSAKALVSNNFQGLQGTQGIAGSYAAQGIQGSQGPSNGPTGAQGFRGTQGFRGYQGLSGLQGVQGVQGLQGLNGLYAGQGTQGIQGIQGVQGVQGLQGLGYVNLPNAGNKTTNYTLIKSDVGKYIQLDSGGAVTVTNLIFDAGDIVSIVNNNTSSATITFTSINAYIAGYTTLKSSATISPKGIATVVFLDGSNCIIAGTVT